MNARIQGLSSRKATSILRTLVGMGVAALIASFAAASPVSGAPPEPSGHILFTRTLCDSDTDPCWEIVVADAADQHETVVAGPYPRTVWDDHFIANWAPDGRSLVFMADFGEGAAIWQVNADRTGMHKVYAPGPDDHTPGKGFNGLDDGPAFTPDGERIIFTRCCPQNSGYGLWSVKPDGTGLRIVTTEPQGMRGDGPSDNLPQVSPNGRLIAFHRNPPPFDCGCYIATVNFAGGHMQGLTPGELSGQIPNWSPDSTRIVFQANGHMYGVNVDGSGLTQLVDDPEGVVSVNPAYSPDGTRIIFGHTPPEGGRDIYTMNLDGTGLTQVTHSPSIERFPHWTPN